MSHKWENVPLRTRASEVSYKPANSLNLIRVFTGRILDDQGSKVSSCGQRRLCKTARMLRLTCFRWAHMSEGTISHVAAHI